MWTYVPRYIQQADDKHGPRTNHMGPNIIRHVMYKYGMDTVHNTSFCRSTEAANIPDTGPTTRLP